MQLLVWAWSQLRHDKAFVVQHDKAVPANFGLHMRVKPYTTTVVTLAAVETLNAIGLSLDSRTQRCIRTSACST